MQLLLPHNSAESHLITILNVKLWSISAIHYISTQLMILQWNGNFNIKQICSSWIFLLNANNFKASSQDLNNMKNWNSWWNIGSWMKTQILSLKETKTQLISSKEHIYKLPKKLSSSCKATYETSLMKISH